MFAWQRRVRHLYACAQIYVFADKGGDFVDDLSTVTSRTVEEAFAEVLVEVAADVRAGVDAGCSADAFASVQVNELFAECFISNSAEGFTAATDAVAQAGAAPASLLPAIIGVVLCCPDAWAQVTDPTSNAIYHT